MTRQSILRRKLDARAFARRRVIGAVLSKDASARRRVKPAHDLAACSLIEVGQQQLADVRYAPLATKIVRRRERSDVPLADKP
jgi:hypothetical protein